MKPLIPLSHVLYTPKMTVLKAGHPTCRTACLSLRQLHILDQYRTEPAIPSFQSSHRYPSLTNAIQLQSVSIRIANHQAQMNYSFPLSGLYQNRS